MSVKIIPVTVAIVAFFFIACFVCVRVQTKTCNGVCCVLATDARFDRHDTCGDGDCLFHAISGLHFRRKHNGAELRAAFIEWMETESSVKNVTLGSELISRSISDMKNYSYATECDIWILTYMLSEWSGENIAIACFNARPTRHCRSQKHPAMHGDRWIVFAPNDEVTCRCHFLQNFGSSAMEHFEALTPKKRHNRRFSNMTPQELRNALNDTKHFAYPKQCR